MHNQFLVSCVDIQFSKRVMNVNQFHHKALNKSLNKSYFSTKAKQRKKSDFILYIFQIIFFVLSPFLQFIFKFSSLLDYSPREYITLVKYAC